MVFQTEPDGSLAASMRTGQLSIKEMVDVVGANHVGIGTDQWLNVGAIPDYAGYGNLADKMLKGDFTAQETAKILGENFLRVWSLAAAARLRTAIQTHLGANSPFSTSLR